MATLAACAGNGPAPQSDGSAFDTLQREILDQSCTSGPCHNPQVVAGGLILTEGFSFENLVGAIPENATAQSEGLLRVTPFDLSASFLLRKIEGPRPGEGSRMPLGGRPLSATEIQFIRDWISEGAPGPETPSPGIDPSSSPTPTPTPLPDTPTATPTVAASATSTIALVMSPTPTATSESEATTPIAQSPTPTVAEPTNTPAVTLQQVQDQIFSPSCAVQFCHSGDFPSAQLNLEDGRSLDELVGVPPSNTAATAAGLLRVSAGDPDKSFLITKIVGPTAIELGSKMPLAGAPLTTEQIDLVRSWINSL